MALRSPPVISPSLTRMPPRARPGVASRAASLPTRLVTLVLAAAVAAGGLIAAALAGPTTVLGLGPLPACRYDDILTAPRAYEDWPVTLVDTILRVPRDYVPPDLTLASNAGIGGSGYVRAVVIDDLRAMTLAAAAAGSPIAIQSAYRSYETQESVFQGYVKEKGLKQARLISARPGHSEHQLGLAIDFKSAGGGSPFDGDWGLTAAGTWMRQHAWQYGFALSYPKGKKSLTCYVYESWHFRYLGRDLAKAVHDSGLTTREYLWKHFTTAIVPTGTGASPGASASPPTSPSLPPSEEPSLVPSPDGSATASESPAPSEPAAASPTPDGSAVSTPIPGSPAGSVGGLEPFVVAVLGLGIAAAVAALAIGARRRRGPSGP